MNIPSLIYLTDQYLHEDDVVFQSNGVVVGMLDEEFDVAVLFGTAYGR